MKSPGRSDELISELPCVKCGKTLTIVGPSRDVKLMDVGKVGWSGGMAAVIGGGFGSRRDCEVYAIGICDECVGERYNMDRIVFIYNGLSADKDEPRVLE